MIGQQVLALTSCVQRLVFGFQNALSNRDGGGKNDTGQSTNQLGRIYVQVI